MYITYIIRSQKVPKTYYTGFTTDIKKRLESHNHGQNKSTSRNKPWTIEFMAVFKNKYLALSFEKYLKTPSGKAFRNKRLISVEDEQYIKI